jgi:hypothetical protein
MMSQKLRQCESTHQQCKCQPVATNTLNEQFCAVSLALQQKAACIVRHSVVFSASSVTPFSLILTSYRIELLNELYNLVCCTLSHWRKALMAIFMNSRECVSLAMPALHPFATVSIAQ